MLHVSAFSYYAPTPNKKKKTKKQKDTTKYMHCLYNSGKNKTVLISNSLLDQQYACEEDRWIPKLLNSHSTQKKKNIRGTDKLTTNNF